MPPFLLRAAPAFVILALLAACQAPQAAQAPLPKHPPAPDVQMEAVPPKLDAATAAQNFIEVADTMEPRIRQECLVRTHGKGHCDYRIMVDSRHDSQPNAFQMEDEHDQPVIAFNLALIAEARNPDELAFVVGHEAAHHILGHIEAKRADARAGAVILGVLAAAAGGDANSIAKAQDVGAAFGERAYSKDYELQADHLGTIIAWDAGYDPVKGAQFFARLPDPGESFLGTHPPNRERLDLVRWTVEQLEKQRRP